MRKIILLHHREDKSTAKALLAVLRRMLDGEHVIWSQDNLTAFGNAPTQLEEAIAEAWSVLVLMGPNGVDAEFENLTKALVMQNIAEAGRSFGRLRIELPGHANPPSALSSWTKVAIDQPIEYDSVATEILNKLNLKPQWQRNLAIDEAAKLLGEQNPCPLRKHFIEIARGLADGKPLTLFLSPYADDADCPSRIRASLLELIDDKGLRDSLAHLWAGAEGKLPPLLWQDHLATLCLLSEKTRDEIAAAISDAVSQASGDIKGPPAELFGLIADFVHQLQEFAPRRSPGLPAVTILTVCPGLRMERALMSQNCAFERVTMLFGREGWRNVDRSRYLPTPVMVDRATGAGDDGFMPERTEPRPGEDPFVRLVKLGGSRDLDGSIAADLGHNYRMMAELEARLEHLVSGVGKGPYVVLGGGLATPPVQVAHAVLLRTALETREQRPRLVLMPSSSSSQDPLCHAESGRVVHLTRLQDTGFDRLQVVHGNPLTFLRALSVAFGGPRLRSEKAA
jgi:hypothetical protein